MSYEWIAMVAVLLVLILVFELAYAFFGVRLTTGQSFKYFYDVNVDNSLEKGLINVLFVENETFSYDVISINGETLNDETNILRTRLKGQDGDVIVTDTVLNEETGTRRANDLIDSPGDIPVYDFHSLLFDGREYLKEFLKDEFLTLSQEEQIKKVKDAENLSIEKIEEAFLLRMKKDNRFRTEEQKLEGKKYEKDRIYNLVSELNDFEVLLEVGEEKDLFYKYTRYTQKRELAKTDEDKARYDALITDEVSLGRENAVYGLKVENLKGGEHAPSEFFKVAGSADAKNVVIMVFNFLSYQRELQFETVSFINSIVRSCSDIYEKDII